MADRLKTGFAPGAQAGQAAVEDAQRVLLTGYGKDSLEVHEDAAAKASAS